MPDRTPKGITPANRANRAAKKNKPRKRTAVPTPVYLEPWERQHGESDARYGAFLIYRDQPAQGQLRRSLERAAHAAGKAPATLEGWSREDHWRDRCAAWDRHVQSVQDDAKLRKLVEIAERQAMQLAGATQTLQAPIMALMQRIITAQQAGEDPWANVKTPDLAILAIRAARAMPHTIVGERLVHGLSTQNAQVDVHADVRVEDARRQAEAMPAAERERFLLGEGIDDGRGDVREKAARRAQR